MHKNKIAPKRTQNALLHKNKIVLNGHAIADEVALHLSNFDIMGAFFWGYSGYSYSGLGITEYTEFQFRKECSYMFQICITISIQICLNRKTATTGAGGRVRLPAKNFSKEHIFCLF